MSDAYERVIYRGGAIDGTLPEQMGAVAQLFGVQPADPRTARVLELGCGTGVNLLSMATVRPQGRYLGVDASHRQIDLGRQWARRAGLHQVELRAQRFEELSEPEGFDYIVCHGVYSWVAPEVQQAALRAISSLLAPQGVAWLSFNALPGWHARGALRAAMLWEAQGATDLQERVDAGRRALVMVRDTLSPGPWGELLRKELEAVEEMPDWYLFHDLMSEHNEALYLHQLVQRLAPHGLRTLATVPPSQMAVDRVAEDVIPKVRAHARGSQLRAEQIADLYHRRTFRRMLLCRAEHPVSEPLPARAMTQLCFASELKRDEEGWRSRAGHRILATEPLVQATVRRLHTQRPHVLGFDQLLDGVRAELGHEVPALRLAEVLRQLLLLGGVLPSLVPWEAPRRSRRPRVPLLARILAREGDETVPNLRHAPVKLGSVQRQLLPLCDGQHTTVDMVNELMVAASTGELELQDSQDQRAMDPIRLATLCSQAVSETVQRLPAQALLEA